MDLGIETTRVGGRDQRWLASSHGLETTTPGTLDLSNTDTAGAVNAYGYIPDGTAVGLNTTSGLYQLFVAGKSDGSQILAGFVIGDTNVWQSRKPGSLVSGNKVGIAVLRHGVINKSYLPIVAQRSTVVAATKTGDFVIN